MKMAQKKQVENISDVDLQTIPVLQERTSISEEATKKKQAVEISGAGLQSVPILKLRSKTQRSHKKKKKEDKKVPSVDDPQSFAVKIYSKLWR